MTLRSLVRPRAIALAAAFLFASTAALAGDPKTACPAYPFPGARHTYTQAQVLGIVKKAIADLVPQLAPYDVTVITFRSAQDYFKSEVVPKTLVRNAHKRTYAVMVNEKLLTDGPSEAALRAIAVHELSHVTDYTQMSSIEFAVWAAKYALTSQATYERKTDLSPLSKGLGCGLMEYRVWLYAHVDAKTRALKEKNYFTPGEIADWMSAHR